MASEVARYWRHAGVPGVDLLRARFVTHRYNKHAHETFTFGLIEAGVEEVSYGGSPPPARPGGGAPLDPGMGPDGPARTAAGRAYPVRHPDPGRGCACAADPDA